MNTDHSVLLPLLVTEIYPIGPVWLTGKLSWIEDQANKPSCGKLPACAIMLSSGQSNKKLFTYIGYKLFSYQVTFINETIPSSWHFFHTSSAHKTPKVYKIGFFPSASKSSSFLFFFLFDYFRLSCLFARVLFLRVSLAALFVSSSYRSLFLCHHINLTVHSREFPFLHLPPGTWPSMILYSQQCLMPSTFPRNGILDVKTICYKKGTWKF